VFSALRVKFVSLGDVCILAVARIILIYHLLRDGRALLPYHPRQGLTRRFYLILICLSRGIGSLQQREDILDMRIGRRYEDLLQISNNISFSSFTDLANLAIHKGSPHLISTLLADGASERDIMVDRRISQALDLYFIELPDLMLAQLTILEILLDSIRTNDAVSVPAVGIFDDLGALVADLAELGDLVQKGWVLVAMKVDLVG
jgi:hypothetical protein